ncbi:MAG: hypothetical protein C0402_00940 [Thermodesulfovibrio sp.]|nr:hypothetical protein [Thermodesulfovibrio sp.]
MHLSRAARLIIIFAALMFSVGIMAADSGDTMAYKRYVNVRFGYGISYPAGILFPQGEADNSDGQRFLSKDGDLEMLVWGSNNALDETIKSKFQEDIKEKTKEQPDKRVTFKYLKGNTYVVSGYRGEKIFYQKTMLDNDAFMTFLLIYPSGKKKDFDPVVAEISRSFRPLGTTARPAKQSR